MFVRIKTTPNSPRRSVQLVEGVRDGSKVRQRIVRHIGVAMDEDELERLRRLGEYVKAKLEDEHQPSLFAPETIADQVIRVGRQGDGKQELPVDLKQLEEEQRLITGIHEVYGEMYRLLGLDGLLPRSRYLTRRAVPRGDGTHRQPRQQAGQRAPARGRLRREPSP